MALDFPASPSDLDTYSVNNVIYSFNATKNAWLLANSNVSISTTLIPEGNNKYFTNTRAIGAITGGDNINIDSNGLITGTVTASEGPTVSPAKNIIYSMVFGGMQ